MDIVIDQNVLRKVSLPVEDHEVESLANDLLTHFTNEALGLSAPQIGIQKRAFVCRLRPDVVTLFINPVITPLSDLKVPSEEGCLSLPGESRCLLRFNNIQVVADRIVDCDEHNNRIFLPTTFEPNHKQAFVIQHETDHLNGILMIDHPAVKSEKEIVAERQNERKRRIEKQRSKKSKKHVSSQSQKTKNRIDQNISAYQKRLKKSAFTRERFEARQSMHGHPHEE